jgi:beta-lactam-binding protein with PASTA domain
MKPVRSTACILAVAALLAGCTSSSHLASGEVLVPNLVGQPDRAADQASKALGLTLEVRRLPGARPNTTPRVLSQSPVAGTVVRVGAVLHITSRCLPVPCPYHAQYIDLCTCFGR